MDELAKRLRQDEIERVQGLANVLPEAAQEETWSTIKPELGLGDSLSTTGNTSVSPTADSVADASLNVDKLHVLLLGPTASGKTSFIHNYLHSKGQDPGHTHLTTLYNTVFQGRAVC